MQELFMDKYESLAIQFSDPQELTAAQAGLVGQWLATNPKAMFDELRPAQPIFESPRATIITRHADVLEVLARDSEFSEAMYTPRMQRVNAHFFLGMPNSPEYEREVSAIRLAAGRSDLEYIKQLVTRESQLIITQLSAGDCSQDKVGSFDLVKDLARVIPACFVDSYLGVSGPDQQTLQKWMRALFWDLFGNLSNDSKIIQAADEAAAEVKEYLIDAIENRKAAINAKTDVPDDVMTRLLRLQSSNLSLDDDGIRRNLTGLAVGAIETTSECVTNIIDVLLDRPEMLAAAKKAAAQDNNDLQGFILEALRFKPQHPFLYRVCMHDCKIARGTSRETLIPAGTFMIAAVWSAMFDDTVIDAPENFRVGRPDSEYILFGSGRHTCFGAHINRVQITEICRSVLSLRGLRRKTGDEGHIKYEGPFPDSLTLEFDIKVKPGEKKLAHET